MNPVAGTGRGLEDFPQISKLLRDNSIPSDPVFTEHKYHAVELTVTAVNKGYRKIIVIGGDGTLHEVVNGLFIQKSVRPDEVLLAAAQICAFFSDGKAGDKIPVDYCERRFVKKPPRAKARGGAYRNAGRKAAKAVRRAFCPRRTGPAPCPRAGGGSRG